MKALHNLLTLTTIFCGLALIGCGKKNSSEKIIATEEPEAVPEIIYNTDAPKSMIAAMAQACGGFDNLKALKDVQFDFQYLKADGKKDISVERYIFEGEISWAKYSIHEENVSPDLEGDVVQLYNGKSAVVFHNGDTLTDPKALGTAHFLRQANYMWFTMMFKLADPGTTHKYQGSEDIEGIAYDKVLVSYDSTVTGKEKNDSYILYINPATKLVDQFHFSLPAFGIIDPILLAKITYKDIDGIKVISRRQIFSPSPEGEMMPMVDQIIENITFNNGFTLDQLSKEI